MVPGFELGASHVLSELSATESHAQPLGVEALRYLFRVSSLVPLASFPVAGSSQPDIYEEQTMHSDQWYRTEFLRLLTAV